MSKKEKVIGMDRETLETIFANTKSLKGELDAKKICLEKNRLQIQLPDGSIPERYQKSYKRLEEKVAALDHQYEAAQTVLFNIVAAHIRENAMGNLLFETDIEGNEYFDEVYKGLLKSNWKQIVSAIRKCNLEKLDVIIEQMRDKFLYITFPKYLEYSKHLSFNCA